MFTVLAKTVAAFHRVQIVLSSPLLGQATELHLPSGRSIHDKRVVT